MFIRPRVAGLGWLHLITTDTESFRMEDTKEPTDILGGCITEPYQMDCVCFIRVIVATV